jgi:predicted  nucleic acid-binding Zn-ribbon protein
VKADPQSQRRLLDLQAIDTTLAQLAHRRNSLPEIAKIRELAQELSSLEKQRVTAQVSVDDLDRDIARMERDVDQVRVRKAKDQSRLDAGTGPARELEALQHELATLARRQGELEDVELELMEQREQAAAVVTDLDRRIAEQRAERDRLEQQRDQVLTDIAKEEEFRTSGRKPLVADLPADLVALYERVRESNGGIGAALLRSGRCGGCRLELSGSERAAIRNAPPDEVIRHEECRRILIRTEESGL